jgi:hypothetical protein
MTVTILFEKRIKTIAVQVWIRCRQLRFLPFSTGIASIFSAGNIFQ